jgi:hypothetical protein
LHRDCKDFPDDREPTTDLQLKVESHPEILFSERSRDERLEEESRSVEKTILAKYLSRLLSPKCKECKVLTDIRNETKAEGAASGSISMLDVFIQKRCIPVVWIPFS